jgi:hypothetical protein
MSYNKPLHRNPPRIPPRIMTKADVLYAGYVHAGLDSKEAAKKAQAETGLSTVSGKPMRSRGYLWQSKILK